MSYLYRFLPLSLSLSYSRLTSSLDRENYSREIYWILDSSDIRHLDIECSNQTNGSETNQMCTNSHVTSRLEILRITIEDHVSRESIIDWSIQSNRQNRSIFKWEKKKKTQEVFVSCNCNSHERDFPKRNVSICNAVENNSEI